MAGWIIRQVVELTKLDTGLVKGAPLMAQGNSASHIWEVTVLKDGEAASLSGYSAVAYFERQDGTTVSVGGTISGNVVKVSLEKPVASYAGTVKGTLDIMKSNEEITISAVSFVVQSRDIGQVIAVDPSGELITGGGQIAALMGSVESLGEVDDKIYQSIGGVETSSTASAAHDEYDLFVYNGYVYRATQNIAKGATITPGTNCTRATLTDTLNLNRESLAYLSENSARQVALAPAEESTTASTAHAAGSYFTMNGYLFEATKDIAVGDTIKSGTNCEVTNVVEACEEIADGIDTIIADMDYAVVSGKYARADSGNVGKIASSSTYSYVILPVVEGLTFLYNAGYAQTQAGCVFYSSAEFGTDTAISGTLGTGSQVSLTTPAGAKYAALSFRNDRISAEDVVQVTGSVPALLKAVTGMQASFDDMQASIDTIIADANYTVVAGKYARADTDSVGKIGSGTSYSYVILPVVEGLTFLYNSGYAQTQAGCVFYKSNDFSMDTAISGVLGTGASAAITTPTGARYAALSFRNDKISAADVVQVTGSVPALLATVAKSRDAIAVNLDWEVVVGKYARADSGNVGKLGTAATYSYLKIAVTPGMILQYNAGYAQTQAGCVFYSSENFSMDTAISGIIGSGSYAEITVPSGAAYAAASYRNDRIEAQNVVYASLGVGPLADVVNDLRADVDSMSGIPYASLDMFASIGFLGDSFTRGGMSTPSGSTRASKPFPEIIAARHGFTEANFANYGYGGSTAETYYASRMNDLQTTGDGVLSTAKRMLYVLSWGINDAVSSSVSAYKTNLANIINALKGYSTNCRIIVFGPWRTDTDYDFASFNEAAQEAASENDVAYCDPLDDPFFASDYWHNNLYVAHPTQAMYAGMALAVEQLIDKTIEANFDYFKFANKTAYSA